MPAFKSAATACNNPATEGSVLIPADQWHPLDGVPAPDYVPDQWDGPQVGKRLIQAFQTLAKLPGLQLTNASGYWPQYRHEWGDLLAQQEADAEVKDFTAADLNRARIMPTAQDVGRMEIAIVWPARYLRARPNVMRVVQRVAALRARELEIEMIARRLRQGTTRVRRINRIGLDVIASGLKFDNVPVF